MIAKYIKKTVKENSWLYDRFQYLKSAGNEGNDLNTLEQLKFNIDESVLLVLDGHFNFSNDIQSLLNLIKSKIGRQARLGVVVYSPYARYVYKLMKKIGIRGDEVPNTLLTENDLNDLAKLAGFEVVGTRKIFYLPVFQKINILISSIPIINKFSLVNYYVLRPLIKFEKRPSISIIIPAKDEMGNIENAVLRMPNLDTKTEIIFVEGNSKDNTWGEIERIKEKYKLSHDIKSYKQSGKGKNDAVRLGFSKASNEVLTILDADLTMPPEKLPLFYNAYVEGHADFINGSRLLYPMEGNAMKFLNRLGNIFFVKFLNWILGVQLGDTLCGTKLMSRKDYNRFVKWRNWFGDFDPFGDFELIFPASVLNLGIVDVPIYYRARTYGETNIRRFYHGFILLKMCIVGILLIKFKFKKQYAK
jgi:hypothetical protein